MSDRTMLSRQFAVFCAYLGSPPAEVGERALDYYCAAHASLPPNADRLDRWLVALASVGTFGCSMADAYARRVRPYGLLRRKLVLTLAVLESGRASHARFDEARAASMFATVVALGASGIWWSLRTLIACVLLAPMHLAAAVAPGGRDG